MRPSRVLAVLSLTAIGLFGWSSLRDREPEPSPERLRARDRGTHAARPRAALDARLHRGSARGVRCELRIVDLFGGEVLSVTPPAVEVGGEVVAPVATGEGEGEGAWVYALSEVPEGPLRVAVAPEEPYVPQEVTLQCPGSVTAVLTPASRIRGRITRDGEPALGIPIEIVAGGIYISHTDASASFAFDRLPPGSYSLEARGPGLVGARPAPLHLRVLEEVNNVEIALEPGGILHGRVVAGSQPLGEEVQVRIDHRSARTDAAGNFVIPGLRAAEHRLEVIAAPESSMVLYAEERVNVTQGETTVVIDLGERSRLRVLAEDRSREPLPGIPLGVEWREDGRVSSRPCLTDAAGGCDLAGLGAGRVIARLAVAGGPEVTAERAVPSAEQGPLVLRVDGALSRLRVSLSGGAVAIGRVAVLRRLDASPPPPPAVATSDDMGEVVFAPLLQGRYRLEILRARRPDDLETSVEITIAGEEPEHLLAVELAAAPSTLEGVVLDPEGAPAAGALVRVLPGASAGICWFRFPSGGALEVADLQGIFTFAAPQRELVVVAAAGDAMGSVRVDRRAAAEGPLRLPLRRVGSLQLRAPRPLEGCWVRVLDQHEGCLVAGSSRPERPLAELPRGLPLAISLDCADGAVAVATVILDSASQELVLDPRRPG